jgi:beta-glucanase (GH16 family)
MTPFRAVFFLGVVVAAGTLGAGAACAQADTSTAALVWQDEFEDEGRPDTTMWRYETGFVRNRELQWYQRENAYVEDGHLVIEGRREEVSNPHYDPDSDHWRNERRRARYTSASLTARDAFAFQYGRVEVRARIEAEPGLWPAIWTVGLRHGWPEGGEIDIMEYYEDSILANVCWADPEGAPAWDTVQKSLSWVREQTGEDDWASSFHVWRMEWTPETIRLYVDDVLLNTYDVSRATTESGFNPLRQPHLLKLNLAIGGTKGGDPSQTDFPARYRIDYVRVYQTAPSASR